MSLLFKFKKGKMLKLMVLVVLVMLVLVGYGVGKEVNVKIYDKTDMSQLDISYNQNCGEEGFCVGKYDNKWYYRVGNQWMNDAEYAINHYYKYNKNSIGYLNTFLKILININNEEIRNKVTQIGTEDGININEFNLIKGLQEDVKKNRGNLGSKGVDGLPQQNSIDGANSVKSLLGEYEEKPKEKKDKEEKPDNLVSVQESDIKKIKDILKKDKLEEEDKNYLKEKLKIDTFGDDKQIKENAKKALDGFIFIGNNAYYKGEPAIYNNGDEYVFPSGDVVNSEGDVIGKGTYDEKYGVFTYTEGTSYYIVSTNTKYEVSSEGKGKRKKYYFSDPSNIGVGEGDLKSGEHVYLTQGGGFYYKNNEKDTVYGIVGFTENGKNIISLTPIEVFPDNKGYRYTDPNYEGDKKDKKIIIVLDGTTNEFKSSSGVLPIGIEYVRDEEGNVYIWNSMLKKFVNRDGEPITAEDVKNKIEPDKNTAPEGALEMAWFGLFLDQATYITSGYSGLSMFYSEPDWWLIQDERMMNILGGIDGWTSEVCKAKITDASEYGIAMSSTTSGAFAHIEGEKIKIINYSSETPKVSYLYKISLEVDPGPRIGGCDMKFKVYVQEPRKSVFKNKKTGLSYTFEVEKGNESVSYKGQGMVIKQSKTNYEEVCINFVELKGHCLAGIKEGEDLCNNIIDGGEKKISLGDDPCDAFPMLPNCWYFTEYTEGEREEVKRGEADWGDW